MMTYESRREAVDAGFIALTTGYEKYEEWMIAGVLADMRRGGIPVAFVRDGSERVEVWRSKSGYLHVRGGRR